jgi:hypothetical protein
MPTYRGRDNKTLSNIEEYTWDFNLGQMEMSPRQIPFSFKLSIQFLQIHAENCRVSEPLYV